MAQSPQRKERLNKGYSILYENIALYPSLGRFRRFAANWAKKLHDDQDDVLTNEFNLRRALEATRGTEHGTSALDCPRSFVRAKYPGIFELWTTYEESLQKFGETLCMSQNIMNLPDQDAYSTKAIADLKNKSPIFGDGLFGLTQEDATVYLGPSERSDTCTWREPPNDDFLTDRFIQLSPWMETHVLSRFRRPRGSRGRQGDRPDLRHRAVVDFMDTVTCIFAAALLTIAMFVLVSIHPLRARIGAVGGLGTAFALLVKMMAGDPTRGEVFGATAAFFAVASVFVSNTVPANTTQ